MIRTLIPAALGLVAIVSLSFYEGYAMKDRWGSAGIEAEKLGERFAQVPLNIGSWEGEDLPVDEIVRQTAGAVNYVSRQYTHATTGRKVVLWLIVGHSRDIMRHTPNICYPSSGFRQLGSQLRHHMDLKSGKPAVFNTAKFEKEDEMSRHIERVFWAFNHPDENQWESPEKGARWRYGLSKALYKLYFTSNVIDEDTIEESPAIEFAELMLPAIDAALFPTVAGEAGAGVGAGEFDATVPNTVGNDTVETDAVETDTAETDTEEIDTREADESTLLDPAVDTSLPN